MSHIGIITLLLGQIITDVLQVESFVHLERGDRRNYSVSFDDNELIFMLPLEGGTSNRVVSIPEGILKKDSVIKHPELEELEIKVRTYAAATSEFNNSQKGRSVRGIWGRGLIQSLLGLGSGTVHTIKDGKYNINNN